MTKSKQIVDIEKALAEKKDIQKAFFDEHGYSSSILAFLITYFEEKREK